MPKMMLIKLACFAHFFMVLCCSNLLHIKKEREECPSSFFEFKMPKKSCCRNAKQNGARRQPGKFVTGVSDFQLKEASFYSIQMERLPISNNQNENSHAQFHSNSIQAKSLRLSDLKNFKMNRRCLCAYVFENNKELKKPLLASGNELSLPQNPAFSGVERCSQKMKTLAGQRCSQKIKTLAGHREVSIGRITSKKRKGENTDEVEEERASIVEEVIGVINALFKNIQNSSSSLGWNIFSQVSPQMWHSQDAMLAMVPTATLLKMRYLKRLQMLIQQIVSKMFHFVIKDFMHASDITDIHL